jgi:hypothetical protein
MRFRQFLMRGKGDATAEWGLVCAACNFLKKPQTDPKAGRAALFIDKLGYEQKCFRAEIPMQMR